jgi:low affinity Fe/Cu permease
MSLTTLLIAVAAILALVVVVVAVLVLRDPAAAQRRIESVFRRPERPAKIAGNEQYYRPYWSR